MRTMKLHIRWMIRRDFPDIQDIYQSNSIPWNEEDLLVPLRQLNTIGTVIENSNEKVIGFMVYQLHKTYIEIIKLGIHSFFQRERIGTTLIDKLKSKLTDHRRSQIRIEVRETDLPIQLFLQRNGFIAIRMIREAFDDTNEDSYLMVYSI
jgi:[ribosomal protein S18]-alanine N-acetyltransferase